MPYCTECEKERPESKMVDDSMCVYCDAKIDWAQTKLGTFLE